MQYAQKIESLRKWMLENGCLIHPSLDIPSNINGVQGISTRNPLSHKTLVIAIPSKLILTVTKCYNDPALNKLFQKNDDLFDYEATEDAQFNILCVFMMYHKLNIENSPWKQYLNTIGEPETAIDWPNPLLKGLNKSLIEEIIHIRIECSKLENELISFLLKRKEFQSFSEELLRKTFNYCYRSVMTRCFGYYFNEACLIPIADLINHSCQAVDHQLIHLNYEKGKEFYEGYSQRKARIDCSLIGLDKPEKLNLPFRQRFLVEKGILKDDLNELTQLNRQKIHNYICEYNYEKLKTSDFELQNMQFCSEDEDEDNDTDEQFEIEQVRELEMLHKSEEEQMQEFKKQHVVVSQYSEIEKKLNQIGYQIQKTELQSQKDEAKQVKIEDVTDASLKEQEKTQKQTQKPSEQTQNSLKQEIKQIQSTQKTPQTQKVEIVNSQNIPIRQLQDSESEPDSKQDEWGLQPCAYFTMSTSAPVAANTQLYNSYGSRTNKFLLIWYGFTYANNLYDSVTFRLQVQFNELRPPSQIVLDSYVGGQGLSFKKSNQQIVKDTEISREFRLKRSHLNLKLIAFLRLFLMNFYSGKDLYKLFVTFPASINFELFVLDYYLQIVKSLYERYPQSMIQELKSQYNNTSDCKTKFKIIYLQQQRKLLDVNKWAIQAAIRVLKRCGETSKKIEKEFYLDEKIQTIRVIKQYLVQANKYFAYIRYEQEEQVDQSQSKQIEQTSIQQ